MACLAIANTVKLFAQTKRSDLIKLCLVMYWEQVKKGIADLQVIIEKNVHFYISNYLLDLIFLRPEYQFWYSYINIPKYYNQSKETRTIKILRHLKSPLDCRQPKTVNVTSLFRYIKTETQKLTNFVLKHACLFRLYRISDIRFKRYCS